MKFEGVNKLSKHIVKGVLRRREEEHRVGEGPDHYITFAQRYVLMLNLLKERSASASSKRLGTQAISQSHKLG